MKKQYNTIVLALSLLMLSINILNAQETSSFTYEITQPVCSPYGSVSLTNSEAAIGQEFELEYYNAIEENSITRNSTLKVITAKEEITGLATLASLYEEYRANAPCLTFFGSHFLRRIQG